MNDDDIIPQTPEKASKKIRKKLKTLPKENPNLLESHCSRDYLPGRTFKSVKKDQIQNTHINTDQNNPYLYYDIDELVHLSLNYVPRNNNIHIVGYHKTFPDGFYLASAKEEINICKIKINFKLVASLPNQNEVISLYGAIGHETHENSRIPVFIVRFYRPESEACLNKYKENLKFIRSFVPTKYLDLIPLSENILN